MLVKCNKFIRQYYKFREIKLQEHSGPYKTCICFCKEVERKNEEGTPGGLKF